MELQAADNLSDISHLPPARCHKLHGNRAGQYAVDLINPFRLIFTPMIKREECPENDEIDQTRITAILIIDIIDYH